MLNLLISEQIRLADRYTIEHEPISSVNLMERASNAFVTAFKRFYPNKGQSISIYCGTGNNGGDGLAIARLLHNDGFWNINVKIARFSSKSTSDFDKNLERLHKTAVHVSNIKEADAFPVENSDLIIDALLGSGLNKPLEGAWKELVAWLRSLQKPVISVDIPTGLKSDGIIDDNELAVIADLTITFQRPKISFLLPESASFINEFYVADIGLDEGFIQSVDTPYILLSDDDILERLKKRKPFSHKGTFGHALIIAGAPETMGAALLCAEASLYTGTGQTTACIPEEGLISLNTRIPEVMAVLRRKQELPAEMRWEKYGSVGIGPGLGVSSTSKAMLKAVLTNYNKPLVLDADALNLLAENVELFANIPEGSILTPHVKEFDRLFGAHSSWWERLATGIVKAESLNCYIVLKNRYSIIFTPEGTAIFNPTGTPAMATGGMGDVLTGMVTSFLAQGYSPESAAILGVFLHGRAGEEIQKNEKAAVIPAAILIKEIPKVILSLSR